MFEARGLGVGGDAGRCLPDPCAYGAVGIVVEAVHAPRAHSVFEGVAVPALPDSGGSVVDRIYPARILALKQQFVRYVDHAVLGQHVHKDGSAEESGLQAVAVPGEVLTQTGDDSLPGLTLEEFVLEGEERRRLHGIEDLGLEEAVCGHELRADIVFSFLLHGGIFSSVTAGGGGHVAHHAGVDGPV